MWICLVYSQKCTGVCTCIHTSRCQSVYVKSFSAVFHLNAWDNRGSLLMNWILTVFRWGWGSACPCRKCWGYGHVEPCLAFHLETGKVNSDPHACKARVFIHWAISSALQVPFLPRKWDLPIALLREWRLRAMNAMIIVDALLSSFSLGSKIWTWALRWEEHVISFLSSKRTYVSRLHRIICKEKLIITVGNT